MRLWDVLTGKATKRQDAQQAMTRESEAQRRFLAMERLEAERRLAVLRRRLEATQLDRGMNATDRHA